MDSPLFFFWGGGGLVGGSEFLLSGFGSITPITALYIQSWSFPIYNKHQTRKHYEIHVIFNACIIMISGLMPYRYTINKTEQITISIQMLTTPIRSTVNAVWAMRPTSRLYMYFLISLYCDLVCVMKKHTKFIVSFFIYAYYVSLSYTLINFVHIRVTRYLLSSQFNQLTLQINRITNF